LDYLTEMAARKQLTIILSSHSVSLIKRIERRRLIFLENIGGIVNSTVGCYPTYALGNIAYDEERAPDVILYVEDDNAMVIVERILHLVLKAKFAASQSKWPTVHVVPIGPFMSVVRFLHRTQASLPSTTRAVAILDGDVKAENVAQWTAFGNHKMLAEFQALATQIDYLPWTPEVAVIQYMQQYMPDALQRIRAVFADNRVSWRPTDIGNISATAGAQQRADCKKGLHSVATHIQTFLPNHDVAKVKVVLLEVFADWYFSSSRSAAMALLGQYAP
jgi:hypothetical protein